MRGMLDEMFKETYDNWWTTTRPDIQSIQEFKTQFKAKYWSESTQNTVRNNLSNGRYENQNGQNLRKLRSKATTDREDTLPPLYLYTFKIRRTFVWLQIDASNMWQNNTGEPHNEDRLHNI